MHSNHFHYLALYSVLLWITRPSIKKLDPYSNDQVEELKILVRLIPIFATTIFINTVFLQIINFGAQEALTMDRRLGRFIVPAASIPVVDVIFILLFIPIYDQVLMPFVSRYTKNPRGISFLQRIGIGLFVSILAAIVAACVERKRRQVKKEKTPPTKIHSLMCFAIGNENNKEQVFSLTWVH